MKTKKDIENEKLRKQLKEANKQIKSLSSKLETSKSKNKKHKTEISKLKSELKKKEPRPAMSRQAKSIEKLLEILVGE